MIENNEQLQQVQDQMARMRRILAALKRDVLPVNPTEYRLMAEGPLEQLRVFQAEVDQYVGDARR